MFPADPALTRRLAAVEAELARLRQQFGASLPEPDARPWLKLTGKGTGGDALNYAHTEQDHTGAGAFQDRVGGIFGAVNGVGGATVTRNPAREVNGATISSFPYYVRAEKTVQTSDGPVYYFSALEATSPEFYDPTYTPYSTGGVMLPSTVGTLTFTSTGRYVVWGSVTSSWGVHSFGGLGYPYLVMTGLIGTGVGSARALNRNFHIYGHGQPGNSAEITHLTFGVEVTTAPMSLILSASPANLASFSGNCVLWSQTGAFQAIRHPL